jgi:hypothetical protein|nr:MAG TPA: hypothetical protein [Caudoviricetes sp.]
MAKTIREIRLTFNEKDKDISEWLKGKSSQTAYIKDILRLHMQIEQSYLANGVNVEQGVSRETVKIEEKKQDEFDFSLDDLGL